jgi:hypothetical protein
LSLSGVLIATSKRPDEGLGYTEIELSATFGVTSVRRQAVKTIPPRPLTEFVDLITPPFEIKVEVFRPIAEPTIDEK